MVSLTNLAAERSTCKRAKVGAVIFREDTVLCVSYNGAPSVVPHCKDVGCHVVDGHCVTATHAEINAIAVCAREGIRIGGASMMVTHLPCHACAKAITRAGLQALLFLNYYGVSTPVELNDLLRLMPDLRIYHATSERLTEL
ncbi:MAG: hypothetical protein KDA94_16935, partial [Acidimicrobiales bacterium]|nr:hypothetical protein [Acidimicrobiales bacterium]